MNLRTNVIRTNARGLALLCWLPFTALLLAAGCAAIPEPMGPEVLVTFPMADQALSTAGGSRRTYHSGDHWQVPLHTRQQARRFARDHGLIERGAWPIDVLGVYCVAYAATDARTPEQLLARLQGDPRAGLVQANSEFTGMISTAESLYNDPLVDVQYGRFVKQLSDLHQITGGENVKIGVIDTSVDLEHPDLLGQVTRQIELVPAAAPAKRFHGTAVTGVIAATPDNGEGLVGIAPHADIHIYGACAHRGADTVCTSFSIAKALAEAIDDKMAVINMSFAGPEDPLIAALLSKAAEADTVLIAAGNTETPSQRFPAGAPGVYSADGDHDLWFARPERLSTRAGGSYQVFFGSSIASAGMTGLAALIRSRSSAAETHELLDWLFDTDCSATEPPDTTCAIQPEQLCE
jgi:subtilisin family serine protease